VEGLILAAVRAAGVPLERFRPMLGALGTSLNAEYVLAARRLYTGGAHALAAYAAAAAPAEAEAVGLLVVGAGADFVFAESIEACLQRIDYASDGYALRVRLPGYRRAAVVADPQRSSGQPTFVQGGARVADVLERFWAGEGIIALGEEFGVNPIEIEDAIRVTSRRAG
jgi:uncharacterized protein (DUF433 family)